MQLGSRPFTEELLKAVDSRLDKRIANSASIKRYFGSVTAVDREKNVASVQIMGNSTASTGFRIRDLLSPVVGDSVVVCILDQDRWVENVLKDAVGNQPMFFRNTETSNLSAMGWGNYFGSSYVPRLFLDGEINIRNDGTTGLAVSGDMSQTGSFPLLIRSGSYAGQIEWGSGSAARDIALYRADSKVLQIDDMAGGETAVLRLQGQYYIRRDAATDVALLTGYNLTQTTNMPFVISCDGKHAWGDGTNTRDTNLYRSQANELATDDTFAFKNRIKLDSVISPSITASQNNWAPTGHADANVIRVSANGAYNITGLTAPASGRENEMVMLVNIGSNTVTLVHESASSTAANRFYLPAGSNVSLVQHKSVFLWYDPDLPGATNPRWRLATYG